MKPELKDYKHNTLPALYHAHVAIYIYILFRYIDTCLELISCDYHSQPLL